MTPKANLLIILLLMIFLIGTLPRFSNAKLSLSETDKTVYHPPSQYNFSSPIIIHSEQDLLNLSLPGNGTKQNPFVLKERFITSVYDCIAINNTYSYLLIYNCSLYSYKGYDLHLENVTHVQIEYCHLSHESYELAVRASTDISILNCTIGSVILEWTGHIKLTNVHHCIIADNVIQSGYISLENSEDVALLNNKILGTDEQDNGYYFQTEGFRSNNVTGLKMVQNMIKASGVTVSLQDTFVSAFANNSLVGGGMDIYSTDLKLALSNFSDDNTVNGRKLGIFSEVHHLNVNGAEYGQIILFGCSDVSICGGKLHSLDYAVKGLFSSNCRIWNTTFENNYYAVSFYRSTHITVSRANFSNNIHGIELVNSNRSQISDNVFGDYYSNLELWESSEIQITHNLFLNGYSGVAISTNSCNNTIYGNLFWNLTDPAYDNGTSNFWDYEGQGNYWDDLTLAPYVISGGANSVDHYPIKLWGVTYTGNEFSPITEIPLWRIVIVSLAIIGGAIVIWKAITDYNVQAEEFIDSLYLSTELARHV